MKRLFAAIMLLLFFPLTAISQRILFQSDFETIPLVFPDSLPAGWDKLDVDQNNPVLGWAVNDSNQHFGGDTATFKPRARSGKKSLFIFWLAGLGNNNLNDDWVWTDSLRIQTGDSLIFWCLLGSTPLIAPYPDSVQVHVCSSQNPSSSLLKLATIKSNDSAGIPQNNNTWREFKYSLSQFNGQKIYIAWRYYMVISQSSGLWINIDDVFIGNHSAIGIQPVSTSIPKDYRLEQNYPNPFNPTTNINFSIPKKSHVKIIVYDALGKAVDELVNLEMNAGIYKVNWDAANYTSGVYFYKITAGDYTDTKRMILVK
jgi:hypothetical protein